MFCIKDLPIDLRIIASAIATQVPIADSEMKAPPVSFSKLPWRYVSCASSELRLDIVLKSGQSFRWRETKEEGEGDGGVVWTGVLAGKVWHFSQPDNERIGFKVYPAGKEDDATVRDYFQLDVRLYAE